MGETNANVRVVPVCFYLGTALFITSFFLPAVRANFSDSTEIYLGWACAVITFKSFPHWTFLPFLVNPLAAVFFLAKIFNRFARPRLWLGVAAVALFVPTWLELRSLVVMLGCPMWVVSVLLMMSEDLGSWKLRMLSSEVS